MEEVRPRVDASLVFFKGGSPDTCPCEAEPRDIAQTDLSHSQEDRHPVTPHRTSLEESVCTDTEGWGAGGSGEARSMHGAGVALGEDGRFWSCGSGCAATGCAYRHRAA